MAGNHTVAGTPGKCVLAVLQPLKDTKGRFLVTEFHNKTKKKRCNIKELSYRYSGLLPAVVGIQVLLQLQCTELHLLQESIGHDLTKPEFMFVDGLA